MIGEAAPQLGAAGPPAGGDSPPLLHLNAAQLQLRAKAFGPFDVSLRAGERVAILGPSGAGKSTLLKLIAGDLRPAQGAVHLQSRAIGDWPRRALSQRRAVLPQSHAVAFGLPVDLVVALGRVAREPDAPRPEIVRAALNACHAEGLLGRRFDTLSGGEQARAQLARVLAQLWDTEGGLLLVDEPLSALDPGLQFDLLDALRDFAAERGHALVAVLHDLTQALNGFDRLWLVRDGRLVGDLPADRHAIWALQDLYGIDLQAIDTDDGGIAVTLRRRAKAAT